jgi:hypothetical protein
MKTPLAAVRIKHSECAALFKGHQFDTIGEFDAALQSARSNGSAGSIAFVITWKDRATFHGVYDLERKESVAEHVARVGRATLDDARLWCLADGICLTITRLFETALAERIAGAARPQSGREDRWRPIPV